MLYNRLFHILQIIAIVCNLKYSSFFTQKPLRFAERFGALSCFVVDIGFFRLGAEVFCLELVELAVFDKMGAALAKFKRYIFADALLADIQHPIVVHGSGIAVGFAAHDHQLDTIQIMFHVDSFQQGLCGDAFVTDGEFLEKREFAIGVFLILHGAAHHHIVVTIPPIFGDALHKPLDALGEEQKGAVLALRYHRPTSVTPWVGFFDEKIRGKAGVDHAGLHFVIAVFQPCQRLFKIIGFYDVSGVHASLGIAFVDIAMQASFTAFFTSAPRVPHRHTLHLA